MSERFTLETGQYQGPLEALLDMIEDRKLSITDISLSEVADAYLAYVEKLPELPLGETAQFILVASTLLLIKSRTLLPTLSLSQDERESVAELERRLAKLQLIRQAAKLLRKKWGRAPLPLARRSPERPAMFKPSEAAAQTVYAAATRLLNMLPKPEKMVEAAVAPILALEDVISNLKTRITGAFRAKFSELTASKDKQEVIVYFLAFLELVRSGSASVTQEKLFEDITIEAEQAGLPKYGT
jgi:segregation and condensation protein A